MNMQAYWAYIQQTRWFAGKSRGGVPADVAVLGWYTDPDASVRVRSELIQIAYPDGQTEWYHFPVSYREEPLSEGLLAQTPEGWAHDATADPDAMLAVLAAIATDRQGEGFTCRDEGASCLPRDLIPSRYRGEQSNTSVFFSSTAMLKFFRRLEPGRNLDLELHEALATSGAVARLYGWIAGDDADLAMLVESLPDPYDGYVLACKSLTKDFTQEADALGKALASVHEGLRIRLGTGVGSGAALAMEFTSRARDVATEVPQLAQLLPELLAYYAAMSKAEFLTQRIHGDFHLGQTLLTSDGWRIVDFEGEPLKTMEERRAMDSPWRDVAGLLRSIDYAAASRADIDTHDWRSLAREAFLTSYCGAMGTTPSQLLAAYELDKAVYEVRYEVRNRPHLVEVPLGFIIHTLKEN